MTARIITNNIPRLLLDWNQLTEKEQGNFDYLSDDDQRYGASFFRYRGWAYDLGEFMRIGESETLKGWDGYFSESFFSSVIVRLDPDDNDYVTVGLYLT